jgi:hypothetical protein
VMAAARQLGLVEPSRISHLPAVLLPARPSTKPTSAVTSNTKSSAKSRTRSGVTSLTGSAREAGSGSATSGAP